MSELPYHEFITAFEQLERLEIGAEIVQLLPVGTSYYYADWGRIGRAVGFDYNSGSELCVRIDWRPGCPLESYHYSWFLDKHFAIIREPPSGWGDEWADEFQFEI